MRHEHQLGGAFETDIVFERGENGGALKTGSYTEGDFFEANDLSCEDDFGGLVVVELSVEAHVIFGGYCRRSVSGRCRRAPTTNVRRCACRPKTGAGVSHRDALIDFGSGDDGEEGELERREVTITVGVVEGDSETGSFVLFRSLLDSDDVTDDNGTNAQMAVGVVPVDPGLGKNRGSEGYFAGVDRSEKIHLNRRLRTDLAVLVFARWLGAQGA